MFKQLDLEIDDKSITLSPQTYPYKARFEFDLGFTDDAKKSHLTAAGAYNDIDEKTNTSEARSKLITPSTITEDGKGVSIELMGKLHLDMAFQPRAILGGTKLKITLVPHYPNFYLMNKDQNLVPNVEFENVVFYAHRSKVNESVVHAHNVALTKATAKYPICRSMVKAFNINSGNHTISIDNALNGQLPRRVFIAMVTNDAFTGNFSKNPFRFEHFNLNHLALYVGGEQHPINGYNPDFENKLYVREYIGLFEALNQLNTDSTLLLSKEQWANGNTIFGFNFAPDLADDCNKMGYANPVKTGNLRIDLKFSKALTETINVLMYCEFDNLVEIDSNRSARPDYLT
jgi:hypothetical protein